MRETPESTCDFIPQDVGGELLTAQDCPEFGRALKVEKAGSRRPADAGRSPSPGRVVGRLGGHWHQWGLRRWGTEAGGGVTLTTKIIRHGARRQPPLPEVQSRDGETEVSAPNGNTHGTPSEMAKMPESRCDLVLHDIDGEGVMRMECPEIKGKG
jgi:hypothetical protein